MFLQSRVPLGPGKFHVVVLVIKMPRCSVLVALCTVSVKRKLRTGGKMQTDD